MKNGFNSKRSAGSRSDVWRRSEKRACAEGPNINELSMNSTSRGALFLRLFEFQGVARWQIGFDPLASRSRGVKPFAGVACEGPILLRQRGSQQEREGSWKRFAGMRGKMYRDAIQKKTGQCFVIATVIRIRGAC